MILQIVNLLHVLAITVSILHKQYTIDLSVLLDEHPSMLSQTFIGGTAGWFKDSNLLPKAVNSQFAGIWHKDKSPNIELDSVKGTLAGLTRGIIFHC